VCAPYADTHRPTGFVCESLANSLVAWNPDHFFDALLPQKYRRLEPFPITGSIERVPTFDFPLTSLCFLVQFAAFRNSEYIFIEEFRIKYFARFSLALCSVFIGSHRSIILAISPLASSDFLFFP
jgi:hypothetical protein